MRQVGHYAELAKLEDAKYLQLGTENQAAGGGWLGLRPANAAVRKLPLSPT